jgi:methyl-accepting chemotaxis protein
MKKKLRIHYVTRAFQWKYAVLSLILAFAVAFVVSFTYKKQGLDYLIRKVSHVYPVEETYTITATVRKNLAIYLGLSTPIIVIFSLLLSHKVAGPLTRIVHGLHDIGEGDFSVRIKLRKGDELLDVANEINEIATKFGAMLNSQKGDIAEFKGKVASLRAKLSELSIQNNDITISLDNIEKISANLEKSLIPHR